MRVLWGLLNLARNHPLDGRFLLDGQEIEHPKQPMLMPGQKLTVVEGMGLVGEVRVSDPLQVFDIQEHTKKTSNKLVGPKRLHRCGLDVLFFWKFLWKVMGWKIQWLPLLFLDC